MPGIVAVSGRENRAKTSIVNLSEIAGTLGVPIMYPLKFMGFELGSRVIY